MISAWWLVIICAAWLIMLAVVQRAAYRCGVWDGAFNHFLPHVRREMRRYNAHKARAILEQEGFHEDMDFW